MKKTTSIIIASMLLSSLPTGIANAKSYTEDVPIVYTQENFQDYSVGDIVSNDKWDVSVGNAAEKFYWAPISAFPGFLSEWYVVKGANDNVSIATVTGKDGETTNALKITHGVPAADAPAYSLFEIHKRFQYASDQNEKSTTVSFKMKFDENDILDSLETLRLSYTNPATKTDTAYSDGTFNSYCPLRMEPGVSLFMDISGLDHRPLGFSGEDLTKWHEYKYITDNQTNTVTFYVDDILKYTGEMTDLYTHPDSFLLRFSTTNGTDNKIPSAEKTYYIDDIKVTGVCAGTTRYDTTASDNTFFDTKDGAAKEVTPYKDNHYIVDSLRTAVKQDMSVIPSYAQYVSYKFSYENAAAGPAKLYIAQFSDTAAEELQKLSVEDVTLTEGSGSVFATVPFDLTQKSGTVVKAFLWKSKIIPVTTFGSAIRETAYNTVVSFDYEDAVTDSSVMFPYNQSTNKYIDSNGNPCDTAGTWFVINTTDPSQRFNSSYWLATSLGSSGLAVVNNESPKYGNNALRVSIIPTDSNYFSGFKTENPTITQKLREAFSNVTVDSKYRLSFYAKTTQDDATLTTYVCNGTDSQASGFPIFNNLSLTNKGVWQYYSIDFNIGTDEDYYWINRFNDVAGEGVLNGQGYFTADGKTMGLSFHLNSATTQPIYFDNIKLEKIN